MLGRERWAAALRFAIARDPFDRLVSVWAYAGARAGEDRSPERFRAWVRSGCAVRETFSLGRSDGSRLWLHAPQAEWLCGPDGGVEVEHLLHFEHLAEEWPRLAARIGARPDLDRVNVSDRRETAAYYDDATRERVRELYARDFALLA